MNNNAEIIELVKSGEKVAPEAGPRPKGVTAYDPCSHVANAQRIAHHYGDRLMYVPGLGWHAWGPPWRRDELRARDVVSGLGQIIASEAGELAAWVASAPSSSERDQRQKAMTARFKWATQSELSYHLEASMRMAEPLMACNADKLDADPMLLGFPNGVLDLSSGEFREHRQADRITHTMAVAYDPKAQCTTWEKFLDSVFAHDAELIGWLQRFFGYCLSGKRNEHTMPICWGGGGNGKGTMLETLRTMFGEYGAECTDGVLMKQRGSEHSTMVASLFGKRFVVAPESDQGGRLNEKQVKALTGGDRIRARFLYQDFFEFDPTHQLIGQTNHKPVVQGNDDGIWRRLRLIPFT